MDNIVGMDLVAVGVALVAIGILGFVVYINNRKSVTNVTFFLFSVLTIIYGVFNYFHYQVVSPMLILWLLRLTIFFAVLHAFSLFQLFYVFPEVKHTFPGWYKYILLPIVIITAVLTLTPLVFADIEILGVGAVSIVRPGPAIPVFGLVTAALVLCAIINFVRKYIRAPMTQKIQYKYVLIGTVVTFLLIILFNLTLPLVYEDVRFIPFAPVFIIPFIAFTTYAVVKYHLLNVRVIATQLFTFAIWIALIIQAVNAESLLQNIVSWAVFVAVVVLGIFLIRSVMQEVHTRERMAQLALDLEVANRELRRLDEAKSDFISIASHQLRTPLSIIKGYVSMIREGTYGRVSKSIQDPLHKVAISNERLINLVSDLLDLSRMEHGRMQYEFAPIDFGKVIDGLVLDFALVAKKKGLHFDWKRGKIHERIKGDANKLRQIVLNLIDNAIKYTEKGNVVVSLSQKDDKVIFSVTDTGPGLSEEEIRQLFHKFVRGQAEKRSHTEGLGLGLHVARLIANAHGGDLSVTSPGKNKGSTFTLSLPILKE